MERDCGHRCPYVEHAPDSAEAAVIWQAGTAAAKIGPAGLEIDIAGAATMAAGRAVTGWVAAELLAAFREGVDLGQAARRKQSAVMDGGTQNG